MKMYLCWKLQNNHNDNIATWNALRLIWAIDSIEYWSYKTLLKTNIMISSTIELI